MSDTKPTASEVKHPIAAGEDVLEPDQAVFDAVETAMMVDATAGGGAAPSIEDDAGPA